MLRFWWVKLHYFFYVCFLILITLCLCVALCVYSLWGKLLTSVDNVSKYLSLQKIILCSVETFSQKHYSSEHFFRINWRSCLRMSMLSMWEYSWLSRVRELISYWYLWKTLQPLMHHLHTFNQILKIHYHQCQPVWFCLLGKKWTQYCVTVVQFIMRKSKFFVKLI